MPTEVLPAIDGHGHRLPKDWAHESFKHLSKADTAMRASDVTRGIGHATMATGVKVTNDNDNRVDKALRSKIGQTTKLKSLLEDSVDKTGIEIRKMQAIKKHLEEEQSKVNKHLSCNLDRRGHRSLRPTRELANDVPHKELKRQTDLLQETDLKLQSKIDDVGRSINKLKAVKATLSADLSDKVAALELDNKCLDMTANDSTYGIPQLPNHHTAGLPFGWKKNTSMGVDEALEAHRQAQKLRKNAFHVTNQRKRMEKDQHDLLQSALSHKVSEIARLRDDLQDQLAQVEDEISKATKVKKKLEVAIQDKMPPLNLAKQRYMTRTKRPSREAIHDEVEHALLMQYNELKDVVADLQNKLNQVNDHLASLRRTKQELEMNIADKTKNYKTDTHAHAMAPSRPGTSQTLNSDALSLRPSTGSTAKMLGSTI